MFSNTELVSRASHELRTPLNAILGFGQLLALEELSDSQRDSVEQIMAGGRHLLGLIDDLLDLSRIGSDRLDLSLEPVELGAAIDAAAALCAPLAAERSLAVTVDAGQEPLWVLADPARLRQVLLNLISNAIKYNRPGGSVELRAGVELRARGGDAGQAQLEVIDTGIGMTEEQVERLFQPFERLDAQLSGVPGTGLGLVVSRSLAEAMDGTLDVRSAPRAGSTFTLRLPGAPARPGAIGTGVPALAAA
jgi:signal transduction histidine kinase